MRAVYLALALVAAAILAFQVVLTRFFALAQGHHFTFMAVSLALLGAGASGTYLSLRPPDPTRLRRTLAGGAALFALAVPGAYLSVNYLPFDAYRLAWEPGQLAWLALYYLALTVPFFCGGLVAGVALAAQPEHSGRLYAANLLGSGLGPPLALLALTVVGGPGAVFGCSLLGWLALVVIARSPTPLTPLIPPAPLLSPTRGEKGEKNSSPSSFQGEKGEKNSSPSPFRGGGRGERLVRRRRRRIGRWLALAVTLLLFYLTFRPPALFEVRLTPYKSLAQALLYPGSEIVFQAWNAFARVDVVRSQGIRSAPGLSLAYPGELPPQLGLFVDGDNLAPISQPPGPGPSFSDYLPLALAFRLRPAAKVLILEPGGGLAVLAALEGGAAGVTVVQSNPTAVEAVGRRFAGFNGHLYDDPRVTVVVEEPRSFLRRSSEQFDLILLPLTDSFRPVTAGAYTLGEDYRYTVEALADGLAHLSPGGLLFVERWLQMPPSECLRVWSTAIAALERAAPAEEAGRRLLALRSMQTGLIGLARAPLVPAELAAIRAFTTERQFDLIWLPDLRAEETNHYSQVPGDPYYTTFAGLLSTPDRAAFLADYPYAVTPPTDDYPFFFHFFRWRQTPQILALLGKTWQPFGGSGYLVLVVLLALVVLLSAGLVVAPLLAQGKAARATRLPESGPSLMPYYLVYFALLGLGFLCVEIPLLQRFILYLGQPAYSFAVVTAALLLASGLGSRYLAGRLPLRLDLGLIAVLAVVYPWLLAWLFDLTLWLPFGGRVLVTGLALLPLGLLMGVPFPAGLVRVGRSRPDLIPWVWAINGCASVISAVLAAMIALTWGFSAVLWVAAGAYGLAALVIRRETTIRPLS